MSRDDGLLLQIAVLMVICDRVEHTSVRVELKVSVLLVSACANDQVLLQI
jgi:hypothetical protein